MGFRHPLRRGIERIFDRFRNSRRLGPVLGKLQPNDDFDWFSYTEDSYRHVLEEELEPTYTTKLAGTDWSLQQGKVVTHNGKPVHPNHSVLYESILMLAPRSVFEFGFGGGDQLANLGVLLPTIRLGGAEISPQQIHFARERHHFSSAVHIIQRDLTLRNAADDLVEYADLVYTQSVLMHIHGRQRPYDFLHNMWRVSRRYIVLVESWTRHHYMGLFSRALPGCQPHYLSRPEASAVIFDKRNALDDFPVLESEGMLHSIV